MSTIIIAPFLDEQGHVNPTFRIARSLRARGHRVIYCGLPDLEDYVQAQGFEFIPVLSALFPKGFQAQVLEKMTALSGLKLYRFVREMDRHEARVLAAVQAGALDEPFTRLPPDLLLCDVLLPEPQLVAHGHEVPCLLLNTTLPLRQEAGLPPLSSPLLPDGRLLTNARIKLAWLRDTYRLRLGLWVRTRYLRHILRLARRHGFPPERLDFTGSTVSSWGPELVLCPREFAELGPAAASPRGNYLYTGPSVDLERQEPDFPWERLQEGRPLVLVYIGTMSFRTKVDARIFRTVLEAAARRPDWQFVLSLGRKLDPADYDRATPNAIAVRSAPHVALLRRAAVMITHGGFNSVKECICMGVPMVVIPLQHDQPGISTRVVHHGLGVRASADQLTAKSLLALLDVTRTPRYRAALQVFSARFLQAENETSAADVIEQFLQQRPSATAASSPSVLTPSPLS